MALDRAALEALVRRHIDAENERNVDAVMRTISSAGGYYHIVASGEIIHTPAEIRSFYEHFILPIGDLRLDISNMIVDVERRQVTIEYDLRGKHTNWLWGLAPTQRWFKWQGVALYEFNEDGLLIREVSYFDKTELLESLRLIFNTKTAAGRLLLIAAQSPLYALRCALGALLQRGK